MKLFITALILVMTGTAFGKTITSSASSLDLKAERPSCEMLGWRWVKSYSRLSESADFTEKILKDEDYKTLGILTARLPEGHPEGAAEPIEQSLVFKIKAVTKDNFKVIKVKVANFEWQNVTENFTDLIDIQAQDGRVQVKTKMSYADWCFYPETSQIEVEVGGEKMTLAWNTQRKKLKKYLKLMQRQ